MTRQTTRMTKSSGKPTSNIRYLLSPTLPASRADVIVPYGCYEFQWSATYATPTSTSTTPTNASVKVAILFLTRSDEGKVEKFAGKCIPSAMPAAAGAITDD